MKFRKPLVVFTPKSLLRHPKARSSFDDMGPGTDFQRVIPDAETKDAKKVLYCSGKVYYDLIAEREERGLQNDIAISRVEQLFPFPYDMLSEDLARHPNAEVTWIQEEHRNAGAWSFCQPRLENILGDRELSYAGRRAAASAATGNKKLHKREYADMMDQAFKL